MWLSKTLSIKRLLGESMGGGSGEIECKSVKFVLFFHSLRTLNDYCIFVG